MHYTAHGYTATEITYGQVDAEKSFMGLTSFRGELPALKDIGIARNCLNESEPKVLNNLFYMNHQWTNLMRNLF